MRRLDAGLAKKNKGKLFRREDMPLFIMAAPTVVFLLIFCYAPMFGLVMAFQNLNISKGVFGSPFVGFKNFQFLFSTTDAFVITRNTVLYNLVFILVNNFLAIIFAMLLSLIRSRKGAKVMQTFYMLPYFLSWAVVSIVVYGFLDRESGFINSVMRALGQSGKTNWYHKVSLWPGLIVGINAWKNVGYQSVLYLAVISGISSDYYEAAMLDGASKFQQARYITLPHLRFMMGISIILAMSNIFRGDFGLFYVVTRDTGLLYPVADVIDTYIYRGLTTLQNVGMSTAAGLYQSVVGFVMVIIVNWVVNKIDPESAMF